VDLVETRRLAQVVLPVQVHAILRLVRETTQYALLVSFGLIRAVLQIQGIDAPGLLQ